MHTFSWGGVNLPALNTWESPSAQTPAHQEEEETDEDPPSFQEVPNEDDQRRSLLMRLLAEKTIPSKSVLPGRLDNVPMPDPRDVWPSSGNLRFVLDPIRKTSFSAEVVAPVIKITKKIGDSFVKGEVLLQQDPTVFEALYQKAKANLDKAQVELQAKQKLFQNNNASLVDLKDAEAAAASAQSEVIIAQKNLKATTIHAPYDGKIASINIEEHELPVQGKEILDIVEDDILIAKSLLPSSLINRINIGDPVTLTIQENGRQIKGKITRIGAVIEPASSILKVEIEIPNSDGKLKTGMSGVLNID
jgi:RND family efflux transporter MFP subunit